MTILDIRLQVELSEHPTSEDCNEQSGAEVERGNFPTQKAVKQDQGDFIDHGRGNKKGEGHAHRDAGRDKTDKERHGGTGAKRRDDAEQRSHDVAGGFSLSGKYFSCSFGGKEGPNDAHAEHDEGEQHKHLGRIIEQELQGVTEMTALSNSEHLVGEEPGKSRQHAIDQPPDNQAWCQEQQVAGKFPIAHPQPLVHGFFCTARLATTWFHRKSPVLGAGDGPPQRPHVKRFVVAN